MRIERVMHQDIPPAAAYAMSLVPDYQRQKCLDAGATKCDVDIDVRGDTATIRTRRTMPPLGFPSLIRKIVPFGVTTTETITWSACLADGGRRASVHVDFHGAPARMSGTLRLEPGDGDTTVIVLRAEFTALVPIVGGKVEKLAAPIIVGVLDAEEATGRAWVAAQRA